MLVELAIGDAYGAGFEFRTWPAVRAGNRLQGYRRPALTLGRGGRYTDDTQMTIAVAEALLSGHPWTPALLAQHFVDAFARDPRQGYAPGFHSFLKSAADGDDFLARIRPTSERSGAAMRAGPIGLLASIDEVLVHAELQAKVTHDTAGGIASAQAAALMVHHLARRRGTPAALPAFVAAHVAGEWERPWRGHVGMKGVDCVRAALTAVEHHDSLASLLRACVAYTGDVDTVATIALAAASWSDAYEADLPQVLVDDLEDGPYGRTFLASLDLRLQAFARDHPPGR